MLAPKLLDLYITILDLLCFDHLPAIQGISINIAEVRYTHSNSSRFICMWNGTWNSDKTTVTGMKWDAIDWRISTKNNCSDRDEMGCY